MSLYNSNTPPAGAYDRITPLESDSPNYGATLSTVGYARTEPLGGYDPDNGLFEAYANGQIDYYGRSVSPISQPEPEPTQGSTANDAPSTEVLEQQVRDYWSAYKARRASESTTTVPAWRQNTPDEREVTKAGNTQNQDIQSNGMPQAEARPPRLTVSELLAALQTAADPSQPWGPRKQEYALGGELAQHEARAIYLHAALAVRFDQETSGANGDQIAITNPKYIAALVGRAINAMPIDLLPGTKQARKEQATCLAQLDDRWLRPTERDRITRHILELDSVIAGEVVAWYSALGDILRSKFGPQYDPLIGEAIAEHYNVNELAPLEDPR